MRQLVLAAAFCLAALGAAHAADEQPPPTEKPSDRAPPATSDAPVQDSRVSTPSGPNAPPPQYACGASGAACASNQIPTTGGGSAKPQ